MKKIIILLIIGLSLHANLSQEAANAYNNGNYKKAKYLLPIACDNGEGEACFAIAVMYSKGKGVQKNLTTAADFILKACEKGLVSSCTAMGVVYYKGNGMPQDKSEAKRFFKYSCDRGDYNGCTNYKQLEREGIK